MLLFIFLSTNTVFGEVLKVPALIHHYVEHVREDKVNSVIKFFVEHYIGSFNHHHSTDNHDHDNLPFKANIVHSLTVLPNISSVFVKISFRIINKFSRNILSEDQRFYLNPSLKNIWQPPRF
jgi:hypothetical protein